ncbi:MAG TPA: hypothetical protein VG013_10050 [Gemmataceae bacterium]|jgi:hypothetical protein|nr:hypothetical protein [Gemmataceae bacterium]
MHGFALVVLGLGLAADPIKLPRDVEEIQTQEFAMPLRFDPDRQGSVRQVRLYVSVDRGKTWRHEKDYKPTDKRVTFSAPRDGLYWFAVQVVLKDGKKEPAVRDNLAPAMKVFVNTERKALKPQKSYEELQREVEDLGKTVDKLQKRIKELESDRKRR